MRWLVGLGVLVLLLGVAVQVARDFASLADGASPPPLTIDDGPARAPPRDVPGAETGTGTRAMAERLARIAEQADPRVDGFLNEQRAVLYRQIAEDSAHEHERALARGESPSPLRPLGDRVIAGYEALLAGDPERALEELLAVRAELERAPDALPEAFGRQLDDLVAIAYLRLGEQENCVAHHGPDSCLLPIRASGVHVEPRGSRGAIAEYTAILEERPGDLSARWLLNVAHMTLGRWPRGVPERWRIPEEAFASEAPFARFVNVAPGRGADVFGLGGGAIMDDLDGDSDLDLMCSSWGLTHPLALLVNDGRARFEDRAQAAGLAGLVGGRDLTHGDVDGDGALDVYVMRGAFVPDGGEHPDSLLHNDGRGRFDDVTAGAGLLEEAPTIDAVFTDVDDDGRLDLFVARQTLGRIDAEGAAVRRGEYPCRLFVNRGGLAFDEQGAARGADLVTNASGALAGDVDADGDADLFVPTLGSDNVLLVNGNGAFADAAAAAGVAAPRDATLAAFLDADQDGDLDLLVVGYEVAAFGADVCADALGMPVDGNPPRLFLNRGDGSFVEHERAGLDRVLHAIGGNVGDFDGDGLPDLYLGTGEHDLRAVFPNRMLRRADEEVRFEDVTTASGTGHVQKGHGVAVGDVDGDGDQDLYCVLGGVFSGDRFQNALFENPGSGHRWLTVRLRSAGGNRYGVGARVRARVERPDGSLRDVFGWVSTGGTYGSSSLQVELGLGDALAVAELEVRWPGRDGETVGYGAVPLDRVVVVHENGEIDAW